RVWRTLAGRGPRLRHGSDRRGSGRLLAERGLPQARRLPYRAVLLWPQGQRQGLPGFPRQTSVQSDREARDPVVRRLPAGPLRPGHRRPAEAPIGVDTQYATGAGRDLTRTELFGPTFAKLQSVGGS